MTIQLRDFIDNLTEVELSQHTFGDVDSIDNAIRLPRLINLINKGVRKLHTTFALKRGTAYLCVKPCCKRYKICHKNTEYIKTQDCPMRLLEILEVIDCSGRPVRLNATHRHNPDLDCSNIVEVWMPKYNELEFNVCNGLFRINFSRNGETIPNPKSLHDFDLSDYIIDIPDAYEDALIYYICSRLYSPITPTEGYGAAYSPSVMYRKKYEEEIYRLKNIENYEIEGLDNYQQRFNETGMP